LASLLRSQAAAYFLLPLACACWAGNHVFARAVAGHAPPASLSLARWIVVVLIVFVLAWPQIEADWQKLKAKRGVMVFLALIGGAAFGTLQYVALQYTTALNMGVVGSVSPAFIVAASFILFRDRLGLSQLFGVAVSASCSRSACRRSPSTAATSSSSSTCCSGRSTAPACTCGRRCIR
jgi:drug/metabolite transporter (DMT)-like permease